MPDDAILFSETLQLEEKVKKAILPPDLREKAIGMLDRLRRMVKFGGYSSEYEQVAHYIDWITNLPWDKRGDDILDLRHTKEILDKNHYGLEHIKQRILEYLAVLKLRKEKGEKFSEKKEIMKFMRAPILCFIGLVGTGKTTIAYSIAEAMGRKFVRIPFGGMGDPLDLRGQSRVRPDAEVGLVIKALRRAQDKNPVVLLDEIDRVSDEGRASIMGVLVELLDPEQNMAFTDHFLDFPFDLSEVLFIATANNTTHIATAVLDRLEPMQMPSYTDEEKITIGRDYVLPRTMEESGLDPQTIKIDENVWPKIVRPLGFDSGVRTLERTINGLCRKIARLVVEGKGKEFHLTIENIKDFLPTY
ncbi:AAA family ATPase [Candidatus Gottesmanbacteria bacterium]|nr:AAA family ATPase [Candidatus Gottesmanbacteria bacterium]